MAEDRRDADVDLPPQPLPALQDDDDDEDDWPDDGRPWLERYAAGADARSVPRWLPPTAVAVAGLLCSLVALFVVGTAGLAAGPVAVLVVLAFFSSGAVPLRLHDALQGGTGVGLALLLLNYAFRAVAALLVLAGAAVAGVDQQALGAAVIVCVLVRVNVHVAVQARPRRTGRTTL